ncbi:hypothetical protein HME9302_01808 [Alteripontixanthobacter maritimus]|uniref:Uncharacterized protein n=1 Tax=Alteripontixanthobacter maritimus TaxID=2161824 RepID=A0A369QBJ3_9SPHN|nr:hypothetical protein [Alteripontixanthobacter maritimus]RDC60596.1 hypothetical protein HME9302_01808 [Alteripontixanthobacter maritimus]
MKHSEQRRLGTKRTPWHLWVIGLVSLLFNAFGANDYLQSQLRNRDYIASMTGNYDISVDQMLAYLGGFPVWAEAGWAFGVWGAVLGSLLLLLRSRFAFYAFIVALAGLLVTTIYQFSGAMPDALGGPGQMIFAAIIWAVTLGLAWYARRMTTAGVLR